MKQNANIFILIGLVVLVYGQLQSIANKPPTSTVTKTKNGSSDEQDSSEKHRTIFERLSETFTKWKKFLLTWETGGIVAEAIGAQGADWLGAAVAMAVIKRTVPRRLEYIKDNTLTPLFTRIEDAMYNYKGGYNYETDFFLRRARRKLTLDLEKEMLAGKGSVVNQILKTAEKEIRSRNIRLIETINFDAMVETKGKKWTLELFRERAKKIKKAIHFVDMTEREVQKGSKLVLEVAKMFPNVRTKTINEALRKIEKGIRKAIKPIKDEKLRAMIMEWEIKSLPEKIMEALHIY